jgi:hypothetical protein
MDRGLTTIKAVVIGLGLLIVGLVIVMAVMLIGRPSHTGGNGTTASAGARLANVAVALPVGAHVAAMSGDGDRLSLLVELADGQQQIMTVDRASGEVLGTLELVPRSQ